MAPRQQTSTQISRPGFRPAAGPVDIFEGPKRSSKLSQLASALSDIAPGLARFAVQKQEMQDAESVRDADIKAAEDAETLQLMEKTYREAREEGIIQEHQDPVFMARYNEQIGRNLGEGASAAWQLVKGDVLLDATTLEEYDAAFNEFYDSWTDENLGAARTDNPALAVSFRQTAQRFLANDRRSWAQQAGAKLAGLSDDTFFNTVNQGVYNRVLEGQSPEALAGYISAELEAHIGLAGGTRGKNAKINRLAMSAALSAAERAALQNDVPGRSLAVLDALREVPTGSGTLGATAWGQDLIGQAESKILQNIQGRRTLFEREQFAILDDIMKDARDAVFEDGMRADLSTYRSAINELGIGQQAAHSAMSSLESLRTSLASAADSSVPEVRTSIVQGILARPADFMQHNYAIQGALAARDLSSFDAMNLYQQAKTYQAAASGDGVYSDDAYRRMSGLFSRLFGSELNMTNTDALQREQAMSRYNKSWRDWILSNPEADVEAKETYLLGLSESLKEDYKLFDMTGITLEGADVPRDPRLLWNPEWATRQVMSGEVYGVLHAVFNSGVELEAFPAGAMVNVFSLFTALGLQPGDDEVITRLLTAQEQFFVPDNNDQRR